jgi:hypothetical protein
MQNPVNNDHDHDHDHTTARILAREFCRLIRAELTPAELAHVLDLNRNEDDANVCHTHDACDANMVMLDAWQNTFGTRPVALDATEEAAVWDEAWRLAKAAEFDPENVHTHHQQDAHAHLCAQFGAYAEHTPGFRALDPEIRTSLISEAHRLIAEQVTRHHGIHGELPCLLVDFDILYRDAHEGALQRNSTHALTLELLNWETRHGFTHVPTPSERLAGGALCVLHREYLLAFNERWTRAERREQDSK